MKKLLVVSAVIALLGGITAQAATIQENTVFPDMNVIVSQTNWTSQLGLQDRLINGNPTDLSIGQSFKIDSPTTLRAITIQNHSTKTWGAGTHVLELWVGGNDGTASNFIAGATNVLTTVDLQSTSIAGLSYITFNLDSDLSLSAGNYGFQLNWTTQDSSHFMYAKRIDNSSTYTNGGWLYDTTIGGVLPFDDPDTPIANDLVFALHTSTVGTVPTFSVDPEELTMLVGPTDNQVTGSVAVAYTADSTMDISISISAESHPGSFSLLSTTPQTLTDPSPSNTVLEFEFDNTVSNLTAGTSATGLATIVWTETGSGITNETVVPLTANTGFAPNANNTFNKTLGTWGDLNNWSLARVPGTLGADRGIIQNAGRVCNVETNFTGVFPYRVWIRTASGTPSVVNIGADMKGMADISVGQASTQYGILNQTAGTVEPAALNIGDPDGIAPSNSYYNLTGGTLDLGTKAPTIYSTGELNIDGGAVTIDQGPANLVVSGAGVVKLQSGSFNSVGTAADDVLDFNTPLEVSGGSLTLLGQNKFAGGLTIIGDAASISIHRFGTPSTTGEVVFVMGETGVSTIVGPSWATLSKYNLTVDGSNYTGGSTTIDLLTAVNLTAGFSGVTVTNFAAGTTASVTQTTGLPGKITLTITVPGYAGWIGGYGLSGTNADWNVDYDGDDDNNFYEYALGGDPTNGAVKANVPTSTLVEDGGTTYFEYVYARRIGTETELDYQPEFGTDLVFTDWSGTGVVEQPIKGVIDVDYEAVTNRVDMTGKPIGFMHLIVDQL